MSAQRTQCDQPTGETVLHQRFRDCGILILRCDEQGRLEGQPVDREDWYAQLCTKSPLFCKALEAAALRWSSQPAPDPFQAFPGLFLAPTPVIHRRRRCGYVVGVIATDALLQSEQLVAMCQACKFDYELTVRRFAGLPPLAISEVDRFASLLRFSWSDQMQIIADSEKVEIIGEQLASSYEEISLLYTIIQCMRVGERPSRFIKIICDELLGTLTFGWVAVRFIEDQDLLNRLSGRLIVAGEPTASVAQLEKPTAKLLAQMTPGEPMILEQGTRSAGQRFGVLERTTVVHPIEIEERVIGIVIAGDKQGADPAVSSVDTKLIEATATNTAIFLENAALYEDLNRMFLGALEALTTSIDAKDPYTCGHSRRVAHLTRQLAQELGIDEHLIDRMHMAGLVHDIGKIGVPEQVLLKPGRLTEEEFSWIRRHPDIGYRILKDIPRMEDILPGVLHHHERWDGGGYPHGLSRERIPLLARIIALADSFDAMSSTRTYRSALSREHVINEIRESAGTQFDPELASVFVELDFSEYDRLVAEHRDRPQDPPVAA
jgi:HD-GYP domain-containing protein (c-di-GMP phosphodiesterase class II)